MADRVCNKDCLRCPYPDCIYDGLDADDILEQDRRDAELLPGHADREKRRQKYLRYYDAHREEILERNKRWRREHQDYVQAYRETNRERINARQRAYYREQKQKKNARRAATTPGGA